ncbi:hypothetical protein HZA56_12235 [Candidatus Poribacteria bacterium]|nr:hypothetical protein [Candidatus Poribacteria bacterium]
MSMRTISLTLAVIIILVVSSGWSLFWMRTVKVEQPIQFNHQKHHVELELECGFCHPYVSNNAAAGLPGAELCGTCHEVGVANDNPRFAEVTTAVQGYLERREAIPWVRMYQAPSHVIFSHERHLEAHVDCSECHGATGVGTIPLAEPRRITMKSCVECHEKRRASLDCLACHK